MPSLFGMASWKPTGPHDHLEYSGCRAGTMPIDRACARINSTTSTDPFATQSSSTCYGAIAFDGEYPDGRAASAMRNTSVRRRVKRWDGIQRATTVWDSLRRVCIPVHSPCRETDGFWRFLQDPELWFPAGDCLIHFYGPGQSRRGPSLRVSLAYIQSSDFHSFLDRYPPKPILMSPVPSDACSRRSSLLDVIYEVYVPAPMHLSREDAFRYHLTTRNLFAWMYDLPVVGERLGEALVALLERVNDFRPNNAMNEDDLLAYLAIQDYVDFRHCPDHALALLYLAENCRNRNLWTEAFAHCAGMYDDLALSGEFEVDPPSSLVGRMSSWLTESSWSLALPKLGFSEHIWKRTCAWSMPDDPSGPFSRTTCRAPTWGLDARRKPIWSAFDPSCTHSMWEGMVIGHQPR